MFNNRKCVWKYEKKRKERGKERGKNAHGDIGGDREEVLPNRKAQGRS